MNEKQLEYKEEIKDKTSPELASESKDLNNTFVMKYRELVNQKKQDAHLLYYESELSYLLVNHFEEPYSNKDSKYSYYDLRRFPRQKYHKVLMNHPIIRNRLSPSMKTPGLMQPSNVASASFTSLVKRLESKGWLKRIKDGRKLYLKITENGMMKIRSHYEYHKCGII